MKITLSDLTTKTLATFADRVINSSQSGRYTVVENHPLLKKVITEYALYQKVYSKLIYSGQGQDVAQLDAARDAAYSALRSYIKGAAGLSYAPHHAGAKALYLVFENFGKGITEMNYAEETAQLKKLFAELDKPENTEKFEAMAILPAYEEVKQAQQDFEESYAVQAEANTDLRSLPSASAIRKRLEKALRNYLDTLTSMKEEEGWEKIYIEISELAKGVKSNASPDAPTGATKN